MSTSAKELSVDVMTAGSADSAVALTGGLRTEGLLRERTDGLLVLATVIHVAFVLAWPNAFILACGIWWISNTTSHNFIHRPFFRSKAWNRGFAIYLSIITGIPQQIWRERHLAHHAEKQWQMRWSKELGVQLCVIAAAWTTVIVISLMFAVTVVAPGFLGAMVLCWLQGYFEHAGGVTSNYGRWYNLLFFNDGFHVEHHARPHVHWSHLPSERREERSSRWPAVLRWADYLNLNGLERIFAEWPWAQRWLIRRHRSALERLAMQMETPRRVAIIGGGLFPRTALIVRLVWPEAEVAIFDADQKHLEHCRKWLHGNEQLFHRRVTAENLPEADVVFVPLALHESKDGFYSRSRSAQIIVHDWIWNRTKESVIVSPLLLKRMNLIKP